MISQEAEREDDCNNLRKNWKKEEDGDNDDDRNDSSSLPWKPVYHFKSPALNLVNPDLPQRDHLSLDDIISPNVKAIVLMNYLVDVSFLASQCPALLDTEKKVLLLHGSKGRTNDLKKQCDQNKVYHWVISEVNMEEERFGTHHSKIILAFYETGVRVCIMTANLTPVDIHCLTQGIFVQDFPFAVGAEDMELLKQDSEANDIFRTPLLQYLARLKRSLSPLSQNILAQRLAQLQNTDFRHCKAALVPATPGRHESTRDRWGASRLAALLSKYRRARDKSSGSRHLVMQCSSLGSMGKNEMFITELAESMLLGESSTSAAVEIVWPSVECIAQSYLGYESGGSLPCSSSILEEPHPPHRVREGFVGRLKHWDSSKFGRHMFPPHMKCYLEYYDRSSDDDSHVLSLEWFLLTSSNLSQAAWGKRQRRNSTLYLKSYEMGVLFLPSWMDRLAARYGLRSGDKPFSCTPSHQVLGVHWSDACTARKRKAAEWDKKSGSECLFVQQAAYSHEGLATSENHLTSSLNIVHFSVPFHIPASAYTYSGADVPWVWDKVYTKPDGNGNTWPILS